MTAKNGSLIVWIDFTKLGKTTNKDISSMVDLMTALFRNKPTASVAFVTAPVLVSEKLANNVRDAMRRFEDKCDLKHVANHLCTIRMDLPPSTKRVPLCFQAWVCMDAATEADNHFSSCQLLLDRQAVLKIIVPHSWKKHKGA